MYNALISGLEDYTVDERGDVGSWIRNASIQGLTSVSVTLLTLAKSDAMYIDYIPADLYQKAIAGVLKQGVGRLDNVRQQAGEGIHRLLKCPLPTMGDTNPWNFHGEELFRELFLRYLTGKTFSDVLLILFKVGLLVKTTRIAHTVGRTAPGYFPKLCAF